MKFGKNLIRVVELSDPEWGPYWINYKFMKKKINEIITNQGGRRMSDVGIVCDLQEISKSAAEVEFFRSLKAELKKASNFFASAEELYRLRHLRVSNGFIMLQDKNILYDKNTWTRLLMACVKFYKDVLLLENFAIMNYCGFSKILKKHDKSTGFSTREAFMRNVMSQQNFTHYPYVLDLLKQSEKLFNSIQQMESCMPLQDEERLFIEAIRDLNYQASKLQGELNEVMHDPIENHVEQEIHDNKENKNTPPLPPLSRLAALAAASENANNTSVTLDIAAAAAMEAAQRANHYSATYNLEKAMARIPSLQASKDDVTSNEKCSTVSAKDVMVITPVLIERDATEVTAAVRSEQTVVFVEDDEDEVSLKVGSKRISKKVLAEQGRKRACKEAKKE